ncbi:unnamed protein product, partial [Pleuronectes platessa]
MQREEAHPRPQLMGQETERRRKEEGVALRADVSATQRQSCFIKVVMEMMVVMMRVVVVMMMMMVMMMGGRRGPHRDGTPTRIQSRDIDAHTHREINCGPGGEGVFATMEGLMLRLERAVTRLEKMSVNMHPTAGMANGDCVNGIDEGPSQSVDAFNLLLSGPVSDYLSKSRAIGSEVEKHAEMVHDALQTQKTFLKMAATHQQPAKTELHDLMKPISDHIQEIQNFRERNRGSSFFNHLSAVSESIPALGWVAV